MVLIWFALKRKFSQVRRQHMLSLLGLYLWRIQPVSLLLPLPFIFSVKDWFFSSLFSPFFPWLSVVHGSLASCAASELALKTNPTQFQGVVTVGIKQRKAAWPISPGAGVQGEGAVLETQLSMKHFPMGVVSSPPSHGTAISHTVVYQEAKMALLFPAALQ